MCNMSVASQRIIYKKQLEPNTEHWEEQKQA